MREREGSSKGRKLGKKKKGKRDREADAKRLDEVGGSY